MTKLKFFDFEVYPNYWCLVASDEEPSYNSSTYDYKFTSEEEQNIKSKMRVYSSDGGREDVNKLLNDLRTGVLSGYNIKRYDLIILRCLSMNFSPTQLYIASRILTARDHEKGQDGLIEAKHFPPELNVTGMDIRKIATYTTGWQAKWQGAQAYQDLMDDSDKGLKDKEAAYGMDIRESTVPFDKLELSDEDKAEIIHYCKHDVYALHVHYVCVAKAYIETKLDLGETYDIPKSVVYASTNAVLVGKVLGAERRHGTTITDPTFIIYEKPIKEYIDRWVPEEARNHLYTSQKPKQAIMFGNKVHMADGGIHSTIVLPKVDKESPAIYVEADEEYALVNVDLSGCHPSVMIFVGAMPRSITKPERFISSVVERRQLKKIPKSEWTPEQKRAVAGNKLIHNTTYGASGNKQLPLYDDYMRSKICRVSQMIVIAVSMALYSQVKDLQVIQTNTDGILLYFPRIYMDKVKYIVNHFEGISGFEFELEEDSKIWQLNVNNYIALNDKGEDKLKGKSFITSIYQKGYNKVRPLGNHIIARLQYEWYVNKKNPIKALLDYSDVFDMSLTCTKGPTYDKMVWEKEGENEVLGRVARVIAVQNKEFGQVRKWKVENDKLAKDLCANCPPHALVVNDNLNNYVIEGPINKRELVNTVTNKRYVLDLNYYVGLLASALDIPWFKLHKGQLKLTSEFDLGSGGD